MFLLTNSFLYSSINDNTMSDRVILLHGFSNEEVVQVIDHILSNPKLPKMAFATSMPGTMNRPLGDLLKDIIDEAKE